ncbi:MULTISPECIES: regulatory protein RecX [unclassified Algibacter]|uniref:regulatory protein RecX n=1 Tax=unclassified Algibacter TaxID=2615009 RepID=UPI00131B74BD|nr:MULTISPECIES: regulatory protein RecX [unclassified Algibacter]MCL5127378.1 RecX family transcriptional regulator [Algibacter sp. L4_22]
MQRSIKSYTLQEATKKLEHYCAYQERCHQEVRQKLISMHMIPEIVDVVTVHLIENNYLNEERFAKAYVRGKFRIKHWGKGRLSFELKKKDISKFNVNQALAEIENEDYIEIFNELAEKKVETIKESNVYKKRKKFVDYFLYRGWESYLVYEKAHELIK